MVPPPPSRHCSPKTPSSSPSAHCQCKDAGQSSLGISCLLSDVTAAHTASAAGPRPLVLWGPDLSHVAQDSAPRQPPRASCPQIDSAALSRWGGELWEEGVWGDSATLRTWSPLSPTELSPTDSF